MPQPSPETGKERRANPRRRLRDRLASGDTPKSPALRKRHELQNLLLLADDDVRETALALGGVERYLARVSAAVQEGAPRAAALGALAADREVLARVEALSENLAGLRRRLGQIAGALK